MINSIMLPIKLYDPIDEVIYKYEFLLPIAATAIVGAINFGSMGLAAGVLGGVDVIAKYYEIYDKPYLTSATLGWGMLSSFEVPYYISDIIGVTIGFLFPTGVIYPHIDKIVAPVSGAIAGYSYIGGPHGVAIGLGCGVIDEGLSYYNITHRYPLTFTLNNIAATNLFVPQARRVIDYILPDRWGLIKPTILGLLQWINNGGIKEAITVGLSSLHLFSKAAEDKKKSPALQLSEDL